MSKKNQKTHHDDTIAVNRKARFDYSFEDHIEAGLVLEGWEVKSLRAKKAQIADSYVIIDSDNEAWLLGGVITPLISTCTHKQIEPDRSRKLLLHHKEINMMRGFKERKGYTLIPTKLYWKNGKAKISVGLAKGKQTHDKRVSVKDRDWTREKQRLAKRSW